MSWLTLGGAVLLFVFISFCPRQALLAVAAHLVFVIALMVTTGRSEEGASPSVLAAGTGAYEKLDVLGEGGMGVVYRARQRRLGRVVALKEVREMKFNSAERARFRREARVLSGLSSPHTINVFDAGVDRNSSPFYVMEFLDGLNLRQLVEKEGPLAPARVVHILRQAALSLNEAHKKGLIHRDIKPANLMVCRYGGEYDFVKVLDFGLVKSVVETSPYHENITVEGELPGTPAFIAPELIIGGDRVDARADIYSLGAIGYYLLTGKHVFDETSPLLMARAHLSQIPVPVSTRSPLVIPIALEGLLGMCLEKDPDVRPKDAETLLVSLEKLIVPDPWTREDARAAWSDIPLVPGPSIAPGPLLSDHVVA